jgi:hypothetical protein
MILQYFPGIDVLLVSDALIDHVSFRSCLLIYGPHAFVKVSMESSLLDGAPGESVIIVAVALALTTCCCSTADFPYLITPIDAIKAKATGSTISSSLSDSDLNAAATAASGKDVALVFIAADSGEGYLTVEGNAGDRNDLKAWHSGDALVQKVASVNKNTVCCFVPSAQPVLTYRHPDCCR